MTISYEVRFSGARSFAAGRAELTARLVNLANDHNFRDASLDDLVAELEDRDYDKEVNAFRVLGKPTSF